MRFLRFSLFAATVACLAVPAYGLCPSSPENPTLILGGLAGAAYGATMLRTRLRARGRKRS